MTTLSRNARIAGLFYLTLMTAPLRLVYIPTKLIVSGNAAATAGNIAAHQTLFRLGILTDLFTAVMAIFLTLALYRLFKGVDQFLAALVVVLGALMVTPIYFLNTLNDAATLLLVRGADFLSVFDKPQRDAFARLFLDLHHQLDLANFMFAGLWLFPFGLLVYRSRFLPGFLGVWLTLAGFAWLSFSLTGLLFPAYGDKAFSITQPIAMGEVATMLWLVIMGAKEKPLAATASAS